MQPSKKHVALVSGANRGIGFAIADQLARKGLRVIIGARNERKGLEAQKQLVTKGLDVHFTLLDVADALSISAAVGRIDDTFGRLDVLINNAGIVSNKSIAETDMDTWNRVVGVNLTSVMLGCRFAIEVMRNNPGGSIGSIVNIASTTSFLGLANDLVYTTTKTGVVGLTRSVATWCALERLNIRCNTLHPGAIYTAILQAHVEDDPALFDVFSNMAPVGRMGTVEEIANLALFLASDDSSFSTGAQFVADGGISMAHPTM